jgi:hypothetical protein
MKIAPEPILRAGNDTISWACIFCRNQSLASTVSTKMINDIMEAIHEVPRMLIDSGGGHLQIPLVCDFSALDKRNYFVEYLMPQRVAPWPNAYVRGEARSEDSAVQMIVAAIEKSEGWVAKR